MGLRRQISLAHFALAFLGACLCSQLSAAGGMDPLRTLHIIVPSFFALGMALQWLFALAHSTWALLSKEQR